MKKNFYTNPGQKGTGYGYLNVTIGKYVENGVDPYDRAAAIRQKQGRVYLDYLIWKSLNSLMDILTKFMFTFEDNRHKMVFIVFSLSSFTFIASSYLN